MNACNPEVSEAMQPGSVIIEDVWCKVEGVVPQAAFCYFILTSYENYY